jgi:hypothetical protein
MANILGDEKRQQVLALGRLGWPLRRIEQATGVRRETASAYLKAAGITIREPRQRRPPPNPASLVSTDPANPASLVSTDSAVLPAGLVDPTPWPPPASRAPTASARLISRNAVNHTHRFRELAAAILKLRPDILVLDGEVAVFDDQPGRLIFIVSPKSRCTVASECRGYQSRRARRGVGRRCRRCVIR